MLRVLATTITMLAFPGQGQAFDTLERGDRGSDVRLIQRALTEVGIRTRADGVFGRRTARNVRRYEARVGIARDGEVSRGQARGLLRRAGMDASVVDAGTNDAPSRATPRAAPGPLSSSPFPVAGKWEWGRGRSSGHDGVDVMADCGTPLVAPEGGRVVRVASHGSAGHYLVLRVPSGEDHVFMHLDGPASVSRGDSVERGGAIGAVGRSGNASTCHLHFEIWTAPGWYEGGSARDPKPDLERWAGS